jgi:hypothetical protein
VQTAPLELLCEKAKGSEEPRLARLAKELGADALQVNLYDGDSVVVMDCNARGDFAITGFAASARDPFKWQGFRIPEERALPTIVHADVPPALRVALEQPRAFEAYATVLEGLGGADYENAGNLISVAHLVPHRPLEIPGAHVLWFRRDEAARIAVAPLAIRWEEVGFLGAKPRKHPKPEAWRGWGESWRLRLRADEAPPEGRGRGGDAQAARSVAARRGAAASRPAGTPRRDLLCGRGRSGGHRRISIAHR